MKRLRKILLTLVLSFLLTSCGSDGFYSVIIITDGQHELSQNIQGDLLILNGQVSVLEDVVVDGTIHILMGTLALNGTVTGDVSFINGELSLGPSARVEGDLNSGGGSFHRSPASVIEGTVNTGAGVSLPSAPERGNPLDWSFWLRAILNGIVSGWIAAALVRYFPSATGRVSEAITGHSLASGAMGILVGIVGVSLAVTMAYTILLIPVSILLLFLLVAAVFLGWIGMGSELGGLLARVLKRSTKPPMAAFIGMFVFMPAFQLLTSIPLFGGLLGITLTAVGLGAIWLTRFGLRRFIPDQQI